MLDKVIISSDRRTATIHFDTHSFTIYSDENVLTMLTDIVLKPLHGVELVLTSCEQETETISTQMRFEGL